MNRPQNPDDIVRVASSSLREAFNASQIPGAIERGELTAHFLRDAHILQPESVGESYCTRGQMIRYVDARGTWIVEVFQYLRPDGSLGASGRMDPKRMRIGAEVWVVGERD